MSHLSMHDIDQMSMEQMLRRLEELREELLQLRAQQALGGSSSNPGEFKQTRRSIARLLTSINSQRKEKSPYGRYLQSMWSARRIVYMSGDSEGTTNSSNFYSKKEVWENGNYR